MPIKINDALPAKTILENENIFVMTENVALHQDVRPLNILILNLMPNKIATEVQILRMLGNTPLQVEIDLMQTRTYTSKNTSAEHLLNFYSYFEDIKHKKYDGMIITGAPIENLEFNEVDYWDELCEIMEWSLHNVQSTLHICWAAQAGLFYHFDINKYPLKDKLSGIYNHYITDPFHKLLRGFDDEFYAPHSRYTEVRKQDIKKHSQLEILSYSDLAGVYIVANKNGRQFFVTGHSEYDRDSLAGEYFRDTLKGLNEIIPYNYFKDDNPATIPQLKWRSHSSLLYSNWLNYFVYQTTPYNIEEIK